MIVFSYSVVHSDVLKYWACAITWGQCRYHLPFPLPHLRQASVIKPTLGLLWTWKRLGKLSLLSRWFSPTDWYWQVTQYPICNEDGTEGEWDWSFSPLSWPLLQTPSFQAVRYHLIIMKKTKGRQKPLPLQGFRTIWVSRPIHQVRTLSLRECETMLVSWVSKKACRSPPWMLFSTLSSMCIGAGCEGEGRESSISLVYLCPFHLPDSADSLGVQPFISPCHLSLKNKCAHHAFPAKLGGVRSSWTSYLLIWQDSGLPWDLLLHSHKGPLNLPLFTRPTLYNIFLSNDLKNWTLALWVWKSLQHLTSKNEHIWYRNYQIQFCPNTYIKKFNTVTLKIFYAEKNTHKAPAGIPTKERFIVLYILIQLL